MAKRGRKPIQGPVQVRVIREERTDLGRAFNLKRTIVAAMRERQMTLVDVGEALGGSKDLAARLLNRPEWTEEEFDLVCGAVGLDPATVLRPQ